MARDLDLSLLRSFVAVAETGGMTAAGRRLNLTQAAVSQQIKRLEGELSATLFDRGQRRLELTPAGERLVGHAGRILALGDEIRAMMTTPEAEGEVRLGVPHDIIGPFMPQVLRGFAEAWPLVEVSLDCAPSVTLRQRLTAGEIDLALTTEPQTGQDCEMLMADRLVWVGAPDGEAHRRSPLPVSLGDEACAFRAAAVEALGRTGRDWRFLCMVSNMSALAATLEADLAVAPMLSQTVPEGLAVLDSGSGLPPLPTYYINLYLGADGGGIARELARHIARSFAARRQEAA